MDDGSILALQKRSMDIRPNVRELRHVMRWPGLDDDLDGDGGRYPVEGCGPFESWFVTLQARVGFAGPPTIQQDGQNYIGTESPNVEARYCRVMFVQAARFILMRAPPVAG